MPNNFLEIENVTFAASSKSKVNNVSLNIENEGDIVCLLGPSGIGKTTILRTIAGLEKIQSGKILLKGKVISNKNIVIDSKSGFSGAGRGVHKKYAKKNLYESLSAYGVGFHRHNSEIEQEIKKVCKNAEFTFTPHLSPMFRGIMSTIYVNVENKMSAKKIYNYLKKVYKKKNLLNFINLISRLVPMTL